jgi:hypothetical protein
MFTPQKVTPLPTEQDTGWAPQLVWTFWRRKSYCPSQKSNHRPSSPQQNHYAQYIILSSHPRGSTCGICSEQSGNEVFMQVSQIKTFTVLSSKFSAYIFSTALSFFNRSTTHSRFSIFVTLSKISFDLPFLSTSLSPCQLHSHQSSIFILICL